MQRGSAARAKVICKKLWASRQKYENTLTVIDESEGAAKELRVAGVFVCEEAEGQSAVERDAPAGRDGTAVAAAERRVDQVRDVAVLDLDVQVQVLVHAPATPAPHQHPICGVW